MKLVVVMLLTFLVIGVGSVVENNNLQMECKVYEGELWIRFWLKKSNMYDYTLNYKKGINNTYTTFKMGRRLQILNPNILSWNIGNMREIKKGSHFFQISGKTEKNVERTISTFHYPKQSLKLIDTWQSGWNIDIMCFNVTVDYMITGTCHTLEILQIENYYIHLLSPAVFVKIVVYNEKSNNSYDCNRTPHCTQNGLIMKFKGDILESNQNYTICVIINNRPSYCKIIYTYCNVIDVQQTCAESVKKQPDWSVKLNIIFLPFSLILLIVLLSVSRKYKNLKQQRSVLPIHPRLIPRPITAQEPHVIPTYTGYDNER